MRENLASLFSNQLDFIFFFYGLAFILLGATCFAIARSQGQGQGQGQAWLALGWFGFIHGGGEWLDLTALVIGDAPAFALLRTVLMAGSFVFLLEFARIEGGRLSEKVPGRWLYVPLLLLVGIVGAAAGLNAAGIAARYSMGFVGAVATSAIFFRQSRTFSGTARPFALSAAAGFALYGIAAGLVVPAAAFWPASLVNYAAFASLTGTPIQLVRSLLACWISFSIWAIWGQRLASEVSAPRYTAYLRRQFVWTLAATTTILVCGWVLTEFLGGIYRQNVQDSARSDIDLLASRLAGETATVEGMVKALAGSPSVVRLLAGGDRNDSDGAKSVLDLDVEAAGARRGYILDASGNVVVASGRRDALADAPNYGSAFFFQKAIAGERGSQYSFNAENGVRDYHASYPVRGRDSRIVGVAVLTKSLDGFESDLAQYDRPYFFIDPDGVVMMTNRLKMLRRSFWPLASGQSGVSTRPSVLPREIVDATWINIHGERNFVRRRFVDDHSQWSLVILKPTREIFASRVSGIVITLLVTIMALIYMLGKERRIHDNVQMDNRLRLQELARNLKFQATTDPLTGLHNRLKFDEALAIEMARAERYDVPLSLIIFDIDHFKKINDTHGHQVGDRVLIQLSRFVPGLIRQSDLIARWGGEEFVLLIPQAGAQMAVQTAEKLKDAIRQVVFDDVGTVTCSFGVAQHAPGESAAAFVERADDALYRAKLSGRDQVALAQTPARDDNALASVA